MNKFLVSVIWMIPVFLMQMAVADTGDGDESRWVAQKTEYFGDREIHDGSDVIGLEAPFRAADPALTPISVHDLRGASGVPDIRHLYLFVDQNPVPLVGHFEFGPAARTVDLATRVRVEAYTYVRAVAEGADGRLYMVKSHVRASGGCSAPAGADDEAALRQLGAIRVRTWDSPEGKAGNLVQIGIRHPNFSGLQMDQVTRLYRRAHFVDTLEVTVGDQLVLRADLTISVSRDPSLRFQVVPEATGRELVIVATDSEKNSFRYAETLASPSVPEISMVAGGLQLSIAQGSTP
jgi:sulfur-oxidizing protein SoxY